MADGRKKAKAQKVDQNNGEERSQHRTGGAATPSSDITAVSGSGIAKESSAAGVVYGVNGDVNVYINQYPGCHQHDHKDSHQRTDYQTSKQKSRLNEVMKNVVTALSPLTIGGYHSDPSHYLALPYSQQQMEQTSEGNRTQARETQATQFQPEIQTTGERSTPSQQSLPTNVHPSVRKEKSDARAANTEAGARKRIGNSKTIPKATQIKPVKTGQRSTLSQQSSSNDVTRNVHRSMREETSNARAANTKAGARKKEGKSKTTCKVSESARMRPVSGGDVADTLSIIDTEGQKLLPGDGVVLGSELNRQHAIYLGSQNVVTCEEGSLMVREIKLNLTDPFQKMSVIR